MMDGVGVALSARRTAGASSRNSATIRSPAVSFIGAVTLAAFGNALIGIDSIGFCEAMSQPAFSQAIKGKMILAPLTRGGNLPFRRLCADFGMEVSMSEMVYSRPLLKGDRIEQARLRRASNEQLFGVQIATKQIDEGVRAMRMAKEAGADFVDLNCGCPIFDATRRGLGSALLRQPNKLGRLVEGIVQESQTGLPLTVKIRLGCCADTINVRRVVSTLREAGASAVTIHGRTAQQGYARSADWDLINQVVVDGQESGSDIPIVGNGDILTYYEARRRIEESGVDSVMVGRGALMKPWIFQEFRDGIDWRPEMDDRIAVYRTLTRYMKDHFGDDDWGRKKAWRFLPWHFHFLTRYKPYPEDQFGEMSKEKPLIHDRFGIPETTTPLETLMYHRSEKTHDLISHCLWDADSDADAVRRLNDLAESHTFKEILNEQPEETEDPTTTELANIPKGDGKKGHQPRRSRNPKPKRTPEEIAEIRAERAAKKARLEAEAAAAAVAATSGADL